MADSLKDQLAINKAIQDRIAMFERLTGVTNTQLDLSRQLAASAGAVDFSNVLSDIEELGNATTGASSSTNSLSESVSAAASQMSAAWTNAGGGVAGFTAAARTAIKNLPMIGTIGVIAFDMIGDAIEGTKQSASSAVDFLTQMFSSVFNLAKSIFSVEGTIVAGLIGMSNEFAASASEYMQALEDLRAQLGDFSQNPAANVITGMKELTGELANTGLSVWRVFGNNASQLKFFTEMAVGMGPAWDIFGTEIANSAEVIGTFAKGMGLGAEEMKNFAGYAMSSGQTLTETMQEAANYSLQLGPAFGLSAKVISRDVGKMINDVKNFGNMSVKQMTQSAIYTRKLGLEMDKIVGIVSKFDNFEDAAESASQLSQAFGLNIDAMQMMQEQDPAKRIDMIRQAMQQAGKSTENMTRQELALLSSQTGLDEAATRQAFSLQNVGTSYDQVAKAGDDAQAAQLTQAEATEKLAGAIERMVVTGKTFTSFWDALVQGFADGIVKFGPMRSLMMEIHRALQNWYWAGVQLGQMFATVFPGAVEAIQALHKYFSAFNVLIDEIKKPVEEFFKAVGSDPAAFDKMFAGVKPAMLKFFDTLTEARVEFLMAMMTMVKTGAAQLPKAFKFIFASLKTQIMQLPVIIGQLLSGAGPAITANGAPTLASAFSDMFHVIVDSAADIGNQIVVMFSDPAVQAALITSAALLWNKFVTISGPLLTAAWAELKILLSDAATATMSFLASAAYQALLAGIQMAFRVGVTLILEAIIFPFKMAWAGVQAIINPSAGSSLASDIMTGLATGLGVMADVFIAAGTGAWEAIKNVFGIHSPSTVFAEMGTNIVAGMANGLSDIASVMTAPFKGAMEAVSGIMGGDAGPKTDDTVVGMQARVAAMEELSTRISTLKSSFSTDIAAVISEMVKQANELDAAMSSVGDVNLSTGLDKIGKALGVDNKKFTIENNGLNINVTLNVTMDAKELATVLTQKNLLDDNKSVLTG